MCVCLSIVWIKHLGWRGYWLPGSFLSSHMSSIPICGPCTVCDAHTHKACGTCGQLYCSAECQRQHWPIHRHECRPRSTVAHISYPTDADLDRARRKATAKLNDFRRQVQSSRSLVQLNIIPHPGLQEHYSDNWMRVMRCWEAKARRDTVELLSSTHADWIVSHMGSVFYSCIVNRKLVRLI